MLHILKKLQGKYMFIHQRWNGIGTLATRGSHGILPTLNHEKKQYTNILNKGIHSMSKPNTAPRWRKELNKLHVPQHGNMI